AAAAELFRQEKVLGPVWPNRARYPLRLVIGIKLHELFFRGGKLPGYTFLAGVAERQHIGGPAFFNIAYGLTVVNNLFLSHIQCKSKALTTKWDFTVGIEEALAGLNQQTLRQIEIVSLSTTLATNAIVEGEGQKVAMLIMCGKRPSISDAGNCKRSRDGFVMSFGFFYC
ncbi:MAG: hydantoinase/oxoprolinase N-terminal domain-containing protein, partial [Desulfobacterales bacterium]